VKVFALFSVDCVLTPTLRAMTNHFCALVLFNCACGMEHESAANK